MIIRTITCHHSYNHGAMLQAYALVNYLQSLGHDARVIDYWPPYLKDKHRIPPVYNHLVIRWLYRLAKLPSDINRRRRKQAFYSFYKQFIPVTKMAYQTVEQLRHNPPVADLYIAGSDQIWNTSFKNGLDAAFYLGFGSPKRRISYAASFATKELKSGTEPFVKKQLGNLDSISVREKSGLQLLESLGYKGQVVVDPVFLLSPEEWDRFDSMPLSGERYILTYDFENNGQSVAAVARNLARLNECKIYSVSPYKQSYADYDFDEITPCEFVSLVKHAECVIGNSFHGMAFSMIYGKDFFVVNRSDGLNIRMQDLLNRYGLSERLVSSETLDNQLFRHVDYEMVMRQLSQEIESSKSFLKQQIELAK